VTHNGHDQGVNVGAARRDVEVWGGGPGLAEGGFGDIGGVGGKNVFLFYGWGGE
jgi:hypothetical protein